jgi:hypothetical protein
MCKLVETVGMSLPLGAKLSVVVVCSWQDVSNQSLLVCVRTVVAVVGMELFLVVLEYS